MSKKKSLGRWTVLLVFPDYMGTDEETYLARVRADDPQDAVEAARRAVAKAHGLSADENSEDYVNTYDFAVLAVFKGHLIDVNPEL